MRVIILAGGRGSRLAEETKLVPKPMVSIAGKPMLWHIMNLFASQGVDDFLIATGYLSEVIDKWVHNLDVPWTVETYFTGDTTQTGGRIKKCIESSPGEVFYATYGDGLANVNLGSLVRLHHEYLFKATLTTVRPPARFGVVEFENNTVTHFGEKQQAESGWINGGFFVLNREVADYIHSDEEPFETGALPRLVTEKSLGSYQHTGFWKPMDTLRERQEYEILAESPVPPWYFVNPSNQDEVR